MRGKSIEKDFDKYPEKFLPSSAFNKKVYNIGGYTVSVQLCNISASGYQVSVTIEKELHCDQHKLPNDVDTVSVAERFITTFIFPFGVFRGDYQCEFDGRNFTIYVSRDTVGGLVFTASVSIGGNLNV